MKHETNILPLAAALFLIAANAAAQQMAAPTPEAVGMPRGDDWLNYNFTTSFETGYRFSRVFGDRDAYRSMVNFGNGIRLLSDSVGVHSKDGHGRVFDDLTLTSQGLGGDPYESATLRIGKNRLYRYDLLWRQNDYVNPGLTTGGAAGDHALNTTYTLQDHDVTIFPEGRLRFFLGYSRSREVGPGIATVPAVDSTNAVPVFSQVRWTQNEYRVGNEIRLRGFVLNWLHGWQDFKDDTAQGPQTGALAGASLQAFVRTGPNHGTSPYWRVALIRNGGILSLNGRFTYTAGRRTYLVDESASGGPAPAALSRRILSFGDAQRPVATGNFTVSLTPSGRLGIVNQTSVYHIRTEGDNAYSEMDNSQLMQFLYFEYLGIRTVANSTDVTYRIDRYLNIHGGYEFSQRRIRSIRQVSFGGPAAAPYDQQNTQHTGMFGIAFPGIRGLSGSFNAEIARADRPFTPKSGRNDHALTSQIRYRVKNLSLGASAQAEYNNNSVALTAFSSHARSYSGTASWAPLGWFSFDATYSKLHLRTIGGIAYFANGGSVTGDQSYYLSNLHSGTAGVRFSVKRKVDLFGGYSIVRDVGDGRGALMGSGTSASLPALQGAQTFPMRFQSPLGRVSVLVAEKVRLNLGYQRYGYGQEFFAGQDFHANTGYASLLWSF